MNQELMNEIKDYFVELWELKITMIGSNSLTVANIVIALIVIIIGLKISRKTSEIIIKRILGKYLLSENSIATFQALTFYCLLVIFSLIALDVAQIPLSTFAVLGGALAIGFGFGSQNIIKNFISGLILMVEQPIRVGDIIGLEGTEGKVLRIGARSAHIRTFDNIDILVPNSLLLENNVINWTLSDNDVRTRVHVGVAYGVDTRLVDKLLMESASIAPEIIKERPIMIFFHDFGDNSLVFEVQFWCNMPRPSDRRRVESGLRHCIYETFKKENITIAFPQRDVHLDTLKPIEVKMVKNPN